MISIRLFLLISAALLLPSAYYVHIPRLLMWIGTPKTVRVQDFKILHSGKYMKAEWLGSVKNGEKMVPFHIGAVPVLPSKNFLWEAYDQQREMLHMISEMLKVDPSITRADLQAGADGIKYAYQTRFDMCITGKVKGAYNG